MRRNKTLTLAVLLAAAVLIVGLAAWLLLRHSASPSSITSTTPSSSQLPAPQGTFAYGYVSFDHASAADKQGVFWLGSGIPGTRALLHRQAGNVERATVAYVDPADVQHPYIVVRILDLPAHASADDAGEQLLAKLRSHHSFSVPAGIAARVDDSHVVVQPDKTTVVEIDIFGGKALPSPEKLAGLLAPVGS